MRLPNLEDIQINIEQGIVTKKNVHTYWDPFVRKFPDHGWKIYISCYHDNYQEILSIISNFCFAENYSFKFVNDTNILKFLLSKNANRTESGKFITIYPFNENEFVQIIRKLYPLVNNMVGPYILSDKRYLDSKVIYYRYGVISGEDSIMHFKDGTVNDDRLPYYNLPKYVQDPLHENVEKDNNSNNVLEKNYTNISAIHFSNSGGIYSAFNKVRQKEVVLKEARPYIGISTYNDSIICRKREQYYFDLFKENNLTSKLYSEFYEWEHYFIEVEKIEGITFKNFIDSNTLVGLKESDKLEINKRMKKNLILINKLLSAFKIFQSKGLIVNDISENNIIIDKDLNPIFIDLEDAYSIDEVWPGKYDMKNEYLEDERKENLSDFKKDIHKLGYLLMSLLSNSNHLLKEDITGSKSLWYLLNIFVPFII